MLGHGRSSQADTLHWALRAGEGLALYVTPCSASDPIIENSLIEL